MIFMTFGTNTFACFIQYGQNTVLKYSDSFSWIRQYSAANESNGDAAQEIVVCHKPCKA